MTPPEPRLALRLLHVIEHEIVPMTACDVAKGNKLFGAASLDKYDLSLVVVGTNVEIGNSLFHAEIATLNAFH